MEGESESALARIRKGGLSPAETMSLARRLSTDAEARAQLSPLRLVVLASFTTTLLDPYLKVEAARQGFLADVFHGGFGQFEQELLGDAWRSPDGAPEALVVMLRIEDLYPDVAFRGGANAAVESVLQRIDQTLSLFRDRARGPALVANFVVPEARLGAIFDANQPGSLTYEIAAANLALLERISRRAGCHVWDYAGLVASVGTARFGDPRLWALSRTPIATANQPVLARHLARTLRGALRPPAKCLVLDLDNTLWGGVIGDDGIGGIQLGDEHPGRAYKELQRAVLGLRDRGILLAIASKNEPAVVHEALAKHPEMLIASKDFAATRISWGPKSQSLREIAAELNIGLDSLVFFDDNPVERAEVAEGAPEVHVVDVPADPALYVRALCEIAAFDAPTLTAEDRLRARSYQADVERREAETSAGSLEAFLPSLAMEAEIGTWNDVTAQRIAQLVLKTNQFNTTTRRLTEAELAALHAASQASGLGVYWLRLADKYGDMGLVGVGILTASSSSTPASVATASSSDAVIHSLVLSCRVANRGIEQTLIAHLAAQARAGGFTHLVGELIPTVKNGPVADLYPRLGFTPLSSDDSDRADGITRYRRPIDGLVTPDYVRVRVV